jgi:4a-hydroxytetrahydrobiopterin dehydratase
VHGATAPTWFRPAGSTRVRRLDFAVARSAGIIERRLALRRSAMSLADQHCIPCRGGVPPLPRERIDELLQELEPGWTLNDDGHLLRSFEFPDFARALAFANRVGEVAEAEQHHPDLHVAWGRCEVEIWTHKISGLTDSDFYLAAKVDRVSHERRG